MRGTALTTDELRSILEALSTKVDFIDEAQFLFAQTTLDPTDFKRPQCLVTFDDGYADVLKNAAPILEAFDITPTLFVTTCTLRGEPLPVDLWYSRFITDPRADQLSFRQWVVSGEDKGTFIKSSPQQQLNLLSDLGALPMCVNLPAYLQIDELKMLSERGWFIGAHGQQHRLCAGLSDAELNDEIIGSIQQLSTLNLSRQSEIFAYPDGSAGLRVADWMSKMSLSHHLRGALSIEPRACSQADHPYLLPRFMSAEQLLSACI